VGHKKYVLNGARIPPRNGARLGRQAMLQYETVLSGFQRYCSSTFFSVCVVQLCNKLPEELVSASSVSAFISSLNSMCVVFQRFVLVHRVSSCFRAVVCAFWALLSSRHSSALYCFTVLYMC